MSSPWTTTIGGILLDRFRDVIWSIADRCSSFCFCCRWCTGGHTAAAPERIITITGGQGNTIPDKNSIPTNNPTEMNIERKSVDRNQRTDAVQVPPSAFLEVHLTYWPSSSPVLVNRRATTLSYYTLKTINLMSIINLLSRQHSSFFPLPPPRLLTTFFLLSASLRMIRCSCQPIRDRNTFI